jgi:hypothetical protein
MWLTQSVRKDRHLSREAESTHETMIREHSGRGREEEREIGKEGEAGRQNDAAKQGRERGFPLTNTGTQLAATIGSHAASLSPAQSA